jgi:hypothetical protein
VAFASAPDETGGYVEAVSCISNLLLLLCSAGVGDSSLVLHECGYRHTGAGWDLAVFPSVSPPVPGLMDACTKEK